MFLAHGKQVDNAKSNLRRIQLKNIIEKYIFKLNINMGTLEKRYKRGMRKLMYIRDIMMNGLNFKSDKKPLKRWEEP